MTWMKKYRAQLVALAPWTSTVEALLKIPNLDTICQALDFLFGYSSQGDCPGYAA